MNAGRKIFWILLIGIGLAQVAQVVLSRGLIAFSSHRDPRLKEIFVDTTSYDVVYIGSSRTHTTIYPAVVDSVTGLTSYNAGIEGGVLPEFKMTLDGYLLNHPAPELVVLTIDPGSFDLSTLMFDPTQYFGYLKKNRFIEKEFTSLKKKNILLKYVPFLKLTYMDDYVKNNAIKGLMGKTEMKSGEFDDHGFLSNGLNCIDTTHLVDYEAKTSPLEEKAIDIFQAIVDTCKKRGSRLIITYAPEFRFKYQEKFTNFSEYENLMQRLTKQNNLQFYRDDSLSMNTDPCLFANYGHTNTRGAVEYSRILGERIKKLLSSE